MAVFKPFRLVGNYSHKRLSLDHPNFDVPTPPFPDFNGWYNIHPNEKYSSGFVDFSYKACTANTDSWSFQYLHGESEHNGSKPPRFGRGSSYYALDKCDHNSKVLGDGVGHIFSARANNFSNISDHRNRQLSKKWYYGVLDNFRWGHTVEFKNEGQKANYVPAMGISLRYKVQCKATRENGAIEALNDSFATIPMRSAALLFTRGRDRDPVYYAELISLSHHEAYESSGCENTEPTTLSNSGGRQPRGNKYYTTDYKINYRADEDGNQPPPKMGRAIWDAMGSKQHTASNIINEFPSVIQGTLSMTLSKQSVNKIWDEGLMCVGMVFSSQISNDCNYADGCKCILDVWDVKMLVPEHRDDNKIKSVTFNDNPTEDAPSYFAMFVDEPRTCDEASQVWLDVKNNTSSNYYRPVANLN